MVTDPLSGEVTQLLSRWTTWDRAALERLTPIIYEELRRLAGSYIRRERDSHTLSPTELVHEAYLRLIDQSIPIIQSRRHFFGIAAQLMRQ
ncbi:MAG: ECF-type sigma factor, partial [Acidobacteria bacterium]|nr:ECF-type sigma factor [Acidobacteriota bacterium]